MGPFDKLLGARFTKKFDQRGQRNAKTHSRGHQLNDIHGVEARESWLLRQIKNGEEPNEKWNEGATCEVSMTAAHFSDPSVMSGMLHAPASEVQRLEENVERKYSVSSFSR